MLSDPNHVLATVLKRGVGLRGFAYFSTVATNPNRTIQP